MSASSNSSKIKFGTDGWRGLLLMTLLSQCPESDARDRKLPQNRSHQRPTSSRCLRFAEKFARTAAGTGRNTKITEDCPPVISLTTPVT